MLLDELEAIWTRREFINRNVPHCPRCREQMQIQIIDIGQPAQWRCRMCKHRFAYEPARDSSLTPENK
jgi:tRNA(Ile2) C34 agmatinyltransferase TiaS